MPRIDNSDETVADIYRSRDNSGKAPPVDLCQECYCAWLNADLKVEHSGSYCDGEYYCTDCGTRLGEKDD